MRPNEGQFESLRVAAKAADRAKAAEKLRPAFERGLKELGYGPRAIAHAFSSLTGPDTVAETLAELARHARMERSTAVPLDFETVEYEAGLPVGHSLTITGVEHDAHGIRIRYTIRPPLSPQLGGPRGEARDDCEGEYRSLGESLGLAGSEDRTTTIGAFEPCLFHSKTPRCCVAHELGQRRHVTVGATRAGIADHTLSHPE